MSDLDTPDLPSEAAISRALRDIVIAIYKSGQTEDLTVKRVRARAEEQLDLSAGFLKSDNEWKQRSNDVIRDAVEKYCHDEPAPEPKLKTPKKASKPKEAPKKTSDINHGPRGVKRKSAAPAKKSQKRRKTAVSDDESEAELSDAPSRKNTPSDAENEPRKKPAQRRKKIVTEDSEEEDDGRHNGTKASARSGAEGGESNDDTGISVPVAEAKGDVSESELSSLIDESPVRKKQQKKSASEKPQKRQKSEAAKPRAKATKSKQAQSDDPDQVEIKRLQSWLVKCGIRKVWSKELAKYDTPKEKINHLKKMLKDAGMDGRFSDEKAARIKEQREFAKDLEAIQEGERAWGQTEVSENGRPRRRATARAVRNVVVPDTKDSDDNEEDDQDEEQDGDDDEASAGESSDGDSGDNDNDDDGDDLE